MNELRTQPWVDVLTVEGKARERAFIRSAYGWMFGGLLLTALAALWVVSSPALQQVVGGSFWILLIAELALVFFLSFRITKMSPGVAAGSFFVYAVLNGMTLSGIFFAYNLGSIVNAFVAAAGMFGAMALYGLVTKRDLTSWGSFFVMGLIGIVIVSIVNIFMKSDGLTFVISVVGIFVFLGLTAWDNQKLKHYAQVSGPQVTNFAVIGALALYLDFINLFLMLLRLFGGRRG